LSAGIFVAGIEISLAVLVTANGGSRRSFVVPTVTENVSFADASAAPDPIVGMYAQKLIFSDEPDFVAGKFLAGGKVIASNGGPGSWVLFDAESGIYTVILGGHRMTLTLQRGQALVDTTSELTVLRTAALRTCHTPSLHTRTEGPLRHGTQLPDSSGNRHHNGGATMDSGPRGTSQLLHARLNLELAQGGKRGVFSDH
jgi:hypothetical protein